jgi:hypothetical protein
MKIYYAKIPSKYFNHSFFGLNENGLKEQIIEYIEYHNKFMSITPPYDYNMDNYNIITKDFCKENNIRITYYSGNVSKLIEKENA